MELPTWIQISPEPFPKGVLDANFLLELEATLKETGIKLVQLRSKTKNATGYLQLAADCLDICAQNGARLILNGPVSAGDAAPFGGVHLTSDKLMDGPFLPLPLLLLRSGYWVTAACHDAAQVAKANQLGVDFLLISPVLQTLTHPDQIPIGWEKFQQLAKLADVPVFALGGMTAELKGVARSKGAAGIATLNSTWVHL